MPEKMLGIINPSGYEKVNRVYSPFGECPTITARDFKDPIKVMVTNKVIVIGRMDHTVDNTFESANRVYSSQGVCPTIPVCASDKTPKILLDKEMRKNTIVRAEQSRAEQSRAALAA